MGYVGIDFGTTNTAVSYYDEKGQNVIDVPYQGQRAAGLKKTLPSIVFFDASGNPLHVGDAALSYRDDPDYAKRCVDKVKRLIGKSFEQARRDPLLENVAYEVVEGDETLGKQHVALIRVGDIEKKLYPPEDIARLIFALARDQLTMHLQRIGCGDRKIEKVFVTVPANFDDNQRGRIRKAAVLAGFEENGVELLNEPEAAVFDAVAKGKITKDEIVLVFNVGAGTTDLAIVEVRMPGGRLFVHTKAIAGESELGGTDMDIAIVNWVIGKLEEDPAVNQEKLKSISNRLRGQLRLRAEDAKIALSEGRIEETSIGIAEFARAISLTLDDLNEIVKPVVEKCRHCIQKILPIALKSGNIRKEDIDRVILTGGPMAMSIVRNMVVEEFGDRIVDGVDPMMCVARGAAISPKAWRGTPPSHTICLSVEGPRSPKRIEEVVNIYQSLPADKILRWTTRPSEPSIVIGVLQEKENSKVDGIYLSLGQYVFSIPPPTSEQEYFLACHVEKEEDKIMVMVVDSLSRAERYLQDPDKSEEIPFKFKKVVDLGEIKVPPVDPVLERVRKAFRERAPSVGRVLYGSTDIWQAAAALRQAGYQTPRELEPLILTAENLCLTIFTVVETELQAIAKRKPPDDEIEKATAILAERILTSQEFQRLNRLVSSDEWRDGMNRAFIPTESKNGLISDVADMKVRAKKALDRMKSDSQAKDRRIIEQLLNELDSIQNYLQGVDDGFLVYSESGKRFINGKNKLQQLRSWVD